LEILKGEVVLASGGSRPKRSGGGDGRRSSVDEEAIIGFVRTNQPVAAGAIGDHIGVRGNTLSQRLTRMVEKGLLTKTGERRGTRYSAA
jgi:hypothetical protein